VTPVRVLGIDPGIATTGWGLLEKTSPQDVRLLRFGTILTPAKDGMVDRLRSIARTLRALIHEERPDVAAIEELFFAKDSRTAASVGHARGVLLLTLAEAGLPIHEYNPRQVKMALTGHGAADKPQMQRMVQRLLGLKDIPRPDDAADAVAIALCHINTFRPQSIAGRLS
jgi:crossover junction endodeoxyribonuclease RuvC